LQQGAGGAGDAGVKNIADDEDFFASGVGKFFLDGEGVQQGLGRVLVRPVAGIDNSSITKGESVRMAWSVSIVSRTDSPLVMEEWATSKFVTSAERRLAATSKEECVRVLAS